MKALLKKFGKSADSINREIDGLQSNPLAGDQMPGFHPFCVYKLRIALKEYNIGKSNGLRVIYLIIAEELIMVAVYNKGDYRSEPVMQRMVRENLKEIVAERQRAAKRSAG